MNWLNTNFKPILFFLILIPTVTLANNRQYAVGLDLGVANPTRLGNSTTFPLGYSTFSYHTDTNDVWTFISGISVGKILPIAPLYTLQVGVSAHYLSKMNVSGNLQQGISPPFFQSTYSYSINSSQYLVEAKLRRQFSPRSFPYIYLGLGIASNRAYSYSTAVPGYLTTTPNFSNYTTTAFTYSLGFGADYFVLSRLSLGLGYRFSSLGKVGLGRGVMGNTNVSAELTQSHLYINTFLAQLNYFI